MKYFFILIGSIVLGSCADDSTGNFCGDYLSLKLEQLKSITVSSGEQVSLKLIRLEDSRCPKDVVCVRAGEVLADLKVNDEVLNFCLGDCPDRNKGFIQADTIATQVNNVAFQIVLRSVNSYPSSMDIVPQTACFEVLLME